MLVRVICVGKLKERYWKDALAEYAKRLGRFCRFEVAEIPDEPGGDAMSPAQVAQLLDKEGARILAKLPAGAYTVALCVEGEKLDSPGLSKVLQDAAMRQGSIAFVIGGSWGLSEAVKAQCALRLSMGDMTFPHQLARIMLAEQLYRGFKIAAGEQYHK